MPENEALYDVAILGGGPAGATAAALLAREGFRVIVFEKERFPRFKIGESLLPQSLTAFDRLGLRERLDRDAFRKHGGEIATGCGTRRSAFYFAEGFPLRHPYSYQVERATFDTMMLNHAAAAGAEIHQECAVDSIDFSADSATISTSIGTRRARYVIDCSGRNSILGAKFSLKTSYPHLQKFSVYAHFEGVQRDLGRDGTLTRLVRDGRRWFWLIPLDDHRTSVGLVTDISAFRAAKLSPEAAFQQAIAESPLMAERLASARAITPYHAVSDYSYRNSRFTGPRWLLVGDAAGFIDPIFSTGVFLAIHSAEMAADAVAASLRRPWLRPLRFAWYSRRLGHTMNRYLRFVSAWYTEEFMDLFTTPSPPLRIPQAVNAVLAGNLHGGWSVWWRLQVFYFILWLQRFVPVCPRLPRTAPAAVPTGSPV
jgi:flavin-dependent dehydrogenase